MAFVAAMALLLVGGYFARDKVPPVPESVVAGGEKLIGRAEIMAGQEVYQKYGLMDHGSVWGHGSLRGMDFSADTLHRMGEYMRDYHASPSSPRAGAFERLSGEEKNRIRSLVIREIKGNRYDPKTGTLTLTPAQRYAFERNREYWEAKFSAGDNRYGFLPDTVRTPEERRAIADFFFWTAWAAGTNRPDLNYTYTNNWPPDPSVGNQAGSAALIWSIFSILGLFLVLGAAIYVVHRYRFFYGEARAVDAGYKLLATPVTRSQRGSAKFLLVAGLLFIVQIFNGGLLAHYTVHPGSFFLTFIGENYNYSWAKSWHLQLAILWIALSWIGTAIYLAPAISRKEPKGQHILVNILFVAAFTVAVGSLIGEVLSIKGLLGESWYWLGHQGWEYLELGRIWQILLFGGLLFWLVIVYRVMAPALAKKAQETEEEGHRRALTAFYVLSAIFVVLFFGFGLFYGKGTHLTVADYWRWFVVHLWVEGIFEFFGVGVISLFMVTLGLVTPKSALRVAYLTAILIFISGIPGTAHHYFWYGGPSFWLAIGGIFSSLEPVPLLLLVVRAWMEYKSVKDEGKEFPYRWPLYFLTASSFWNFLGAGVFGFLINLPIINYYEHGTYLTSNHGHTALFGVYGMLAIALMLFTWRGLVESRYWNDKLLKLSFWAMNGGLFLMFLTGLLPIGIAQVSKSVTKGLWFARSAAFYEDPLIQTIGNWRILPDLIIIVLGAIPLLYFMITTFPKLRRVGEEG